MYVHDQLMIARQNEMLRVAAQHRLAAQARRAQTSRRHHLETAPTPRRAVLRLRQLFSSPTTIR